MNKKILAITMVVVTLIGTMAMMAGCNKIDSGSVKADPNKQVLTSIDKTITGFKESNGSSPLYWIAATTQKGALTLEAEMGEGDKFSNTLYMNKAEQKYANCLTVTQGEESNGINLYLDKSNIAVSAPTLLGDNAYGMNMQTVYTDLKSSAIWETVGITFEEFEEMYGDLIKTLQDSSQDTPTGKAKSAREMLNKVKEITNQATITVDENSIITITDMAKSINVTYTLSTEQLKQIADIVMDWAGENSDLMDMITENGLADGLDPEKSALENMKTELKKALDDSRTTVKLTVSINPKTEMVMKVVAEVNANIDEYNESFRITLDLGEDVTTSTAYKFRISRTNGADKAESVIAINYERMDAKGVYDRRINVLVEDEDFEAEYEIRFAWLMSDMSYTLTMDLDGDDVVAGGYCKVENNTMDLTVSSLKIEKEDVDVNLRLLIEPNKAVPAMPNYTHILKMTAEEYMDLLTKFGGDIPDMPDEPIIPDNPIDPDQPEYPTLTLVKLWVNDYSGGEFGIDISVEGNTLYDLFMAQSILVMNEEGNSIVGMQESAPPTAGTWVVTINNEVVSGDYKTIEIKDDDVIVVSFEKAEDIPDIPDAPDIPMDPNDPTEPEEPTEPTEPTNPTGDE